MRIDTSIRGVIPILVVPFGESGDIDDISLEAEARFLVEHGIEWAGLGFGSEITKLDSRDVSHILSVVKASAGLSLVGNVAVSGTQQGIRTISETSELGFDAIMVRPAGLPSDRPETVDALISVMSHTALPVVYQDAPEATGTAMSPESLVRLAQECAQIVALKIEPVSGATAKMRRVRDLDGSVRILGGSGGRLLVQELQAGASGTMPGPSMPEFFGAVVARYEGGDRSAAARLHARLLPLLLSSTYEEFLYREKLFLLRRGVVQGLTLRGPHAGVEQQWQDEFDFQWDALEVESVLEESRRLIECRD